MTLCKTSLSLLYFPHKLVPLADTDIDLDIAIDDDFVPLRLFPFADTDYDLDIDLAFDDDIVTWPRYF